MWPCEVPLIRDVDHLSLTIKFTNFLLIVSSKCYKQLPYITDVCPATINLEQSNHNLFYVRGPSFTSSTVHSDTKCLDATLSMASWMKTHCSIMKNKYVVSTVLYQVYSTWYFFFVCFCVFLLLSLELGIRCSLISFCPADHVPDWQPRIVLGMVEARSVNNVKKKLKHSHSYYFVYRLIQQHNFNSKH